MGDNDSDVAMPSGGATHPRAELYAEPTNRTIDRFLAALQPGQVKANHEQLPFLTCAADRLTYERRRGQSIIGEPQQPNEEPMLNLIHASPGTNKSQIINWLRQLFGVLVWRHGVHYVCLPIQHSMAANIDGHTIHHWSGIPVSVQEGAIGTKYAMTLSIKCQCMPFWLVDEIGMASAELLDTLQHVVQQMVKIETLCKKRPDGNTRLFGGITVLFLGGGCN